MFVCAHKCVYVYTCMHPCIMYMCLLYVDVLVRVYQLYSLQNEQR